MSAVSESTRNVAAIVVDRLIATNRGDRDAFSYNDKRYTFQDVAALMNRAGSMLKAMAVPAGGNVLLALPLSPAFVGGLLGAMKMGAVPVVGVPSDADNLARCIGATNPVAAIVHENRLSDAERALAPLPGEAVVVVGAAVDGHRSFIDEMRAQPSWLPAADVSPDAPALGLWTNGSVRRVSHADVAAWMEDADAARTGDDPGDAVRAVRAMLRAFAKGEAAILA
ncbi:MAG TPA: AMP-binding protein [Casimicrobiaceae bacterium]|nr:AMP-binding protein [Casimicrobiaceae bacterium]